MAQIAGKYKIVSTENLPAPRDPPPGQGPPPSHGPPGDHTRITEVKVDGSKYTFTTPGSKFNRMVVYEDGKQTEYPGHREGTTSKATSKITGNTIEVEETSSNGDARKKTYTFNEDGYVETLHIGNGKPDAKIVFKRI